MLNRFRLYIVLIWYIRIGQRRCAIKIIAGCTTDASEYIVYRKYDNPLEILMPINVMEN